MEMEGTPRIASFQTYGLPYPVKLLASLHLFFFRLELASRGPNQGVTRLIPWIWFFSYCGLVVEIQIHRTARKTKCVHQAPPPRPPSPASAALLAATSALAQPCLAQGAAGGTTRSGGLVGRTTNRKQLYKHVVLLFTYIYIHIYMYTQYHRCPLWLIWLNNRGPGLPGGSINYQGHLFFQKGHLRIYIYIWVCLCLGIGPPQKKSERKEERGLASFWFLLKSKQMGGVTLERRYTSLGR